MRRVNIKVENFDIGRDAVVTSLPSNFSLNLTASAAVKDACTISFISVSLGKSWYFS